MPRGSSKMVEVTWILSASRLFQGQKGFQARIQAVANVAWATVRFFHLRVSCIKLFQDIRLNILRYTLYSYNNKNLGDFMSYFF